jgi:CheY-like chemotaxis protein
MGEPVRLQQIAWNLVSNAIKFTEQGGRVQVITATDGVDATFTVEDTGIGISPDFLPHVFDRFRQADGSTSRVHGGLGLGLAIAHALAKMHSGQLDAYSEGVGKGARFTLRMKLAVGATVEAQNASKKHHSFAGLDVLIVEDSPDTLTLLSTIFSQEGANVIAAASANDAMTRIVAKTPDVIISDIGMPDTDGYKFLKQVRALPDADQIPAIAVSGYASEDDRRRALDVGYAALIPKPIDVNELFETINGLGIGELSSKK